MFHVEHQVPHIIAVSNQKGGVGKTTTVINLAGYWALAGFRTLVIDNDPQGNATTGLGADLVQHSIYTGGVPQPTTCDQLALVPAGLDLGAEDLGGHADPRWSLAKLVAPLRERFDLILIDCPPTLSLLPINALLAADELILPLQCEYFALEGMAQLLHFVEDLRQHAGAHLHLAGILLTMAEEQPLSLQVQADVRRHFGAAVFRQVIPRDTALASAPSHGQPISSYDPLSRGSIAYGAVAKEILDGIERS